MTRLWCCRTFDDLERLVPNRYVYSYRHPSEGLRVLKLLLGEYPTELHEALAGAELMPKLLASPKQYPGEYTLVEMEYLDPADGWASLASFSGAADPLVVAEACNAALQKLHACLEGKALHGDLRAPNIFIRWERGRGRSRVGRCRVDSSRVGGTAWLYVSGYPSYLSYPPRL